MLFVLSRFGHFSATAERCHVLTVMPLSARVRLLVPSCRKVMASAKLPSKILSLKQKACQNPYNLVKILDINVNAVLNSPSC